MATLFMIFPDGKRKAFTMSYDDGVESDLRLIDIMRANGLKGTFNINAGLYAPEGTTYPAGTVHRRMTRSQIDAAYDGMEVAVHGYSHPCLERMPLGALVEEVIRDRRELEKQFDTIIRGMALPFGCRGRGINEDLYQTLRLCGIVYARTTVPTCDFTLPEDWLRLDPTCHHDDPALPELTRRFLEGDPRTAGSLHDPWMFYLWGHSYEFDGNDNWELIERFAAEIGGHADVWYATNMEIYDYVQDWKQMQYSADMTRAYNPTARALWLEYDGREYCVQPGERKKLD